jgi:hypothetical protein
LKSRISATGTTIVLALIVAGCAAPEKRELSQERLAYVSLPNGHDPLNPDQFIPELSASAVAADQRLANSECPQSPTVELAKCII